jgi:hypothetical protein
MAERASAFRTLYHRDAEGKVKAVSMPLVDAGHALSFPDEWSETPWSTDGKPGKPVVDIDPDWQDLRPTQRIALAVKLGADRKGLTAAEADKVIAEEVVRREAEAPALAAAAEKAAADAAAKAKADAEAKKKADAEAKKKAAAGV